VSGADRFATLAWHRGGPPAADMLAVGFEV